MKRFKFEPETVEKMREHCRSDKLDLTKLCQAQWVLDLLDHVPPGGTFELTFSDGFIIYDADGNLVPRSTYDHVFRSSKDSA